jgi:hypothetical protein
VKQGAMVPTQSIDPIESLSTIQSIDFDVTRIPGLIFSTDTPILKVRDEQGLAASHPSLSSLIGHGGLRSVLWLIVLLNAATRIDPFTQKFTDLDVFYVYHDY